MNDIKEDIKSFIDVIQFNRLQIWYDGKTVNFSTDSSYYIFTDCGTAFKPGNVNNY